MRQIVRRGLGEVRRLDPRPASPLGPLHRITAVIGQLLPTADVPTSRHSGRNRICPLITTIAAIRSRPTTTIADLRSRALTMHLQALIQRRELIPHRAAAIQLRLAPIPHPAAAIAVAAETVAVVGAIAVAEAAVAVAVEAAEVVAAAAAVAHAVVVEVAEAHTAVEVPAHTVTVKSLC